MGNTVSCTGCSYEGTGISSFEKGSCGFERPGSTVYCYQQIFFLSEIGIHNGASLSSKSLQEVLRSHVCLPDTALFMSLDI